MKDESGKMKIEVFEFSRTVILALVLWMICALGLIFVLEAIGAEYTIYKDAQGRTVLTNLGPTEPGAKIERRYDLKEVTEAEIQAAWIWQHTEWLGIKFDELNEKIGRLEKAVEEAKKNPPAPPPPPQIFVSTGVTVQPVIKVPVKPAIIGGGKK